MSRIPEVVRYRSLAGTGVYDALVRARHADGSVTIEFEAGIGYPISLTRISLLSSDRGERGVCFAKEAP